jgi:Flp pilus assembly protein TadG
MYRYCRKLVGDRTGSVAVEFALIAPILIFLLQGIVVAAIALNKYVMLTDSVRVAVRQLAMSRGVSTTPKTDVLGRIYASAPTLTQGNFVVTIKINGTACTSDAGCVTALNAAQGKPAQIIATYPCNLKVLNYDFAVNCKLTSQTTEYVQ